jgi:hypothetical protein
VIVRSLRDWFVLIGNFIVTTIRTVTPSRARAVITGSFLLKHQLLIRKWVDSFNAASQLDQAAARAETYFA